MLLLLWALGFLIWHTQLSVSLFRWAPLRTSSSCSTAVYVHEKQLIFDIHGAVPCLNYMRGRRAFIPRIAAPNGLNIAEV